MSSVLGSGSDSPGSRHVCAFYSAKNDLIELLAPYFCAGVANRECCLWVVPETITREQAMSSVECAARKMGLRFSGRNLEVVSFRDWYLQDGLFHPTRVERAWKNRLHAALSTGHKRLRVTGDASWVTQEDWNAFIRYEAEINRVFASEPFLAVCTYALHLTPRPRMNQVLASHDLGIIKWCGEWSLVQSSGRDSQVGCRSGDTGRDLPSQARGR